MAVANWTLVSKYPCNPRAAIVSSIWSAFLRNVLIKGIFTRQKLLAARFPSVSWIHIFRWCRRMSLRVFPEKNLMILRRHY